MPVHCPSHSVPAGDLIAPDAPIRLGGTWRILLLALAVVACAPPEPAIVPRFDTADLLTMRWLEGLWLDSGVADGRTSYYERYRFEGDSAIQITYDTDRAMARPIDGGRIVLRDGAIYHQMPRSISRVVRLDSTSITFEDTGRSRRETVWRRDSPTRWHTSSVTSRGDSLVFTLQRVEAP